jgi:hypothetical protein
LSIANRAVDLAPWSPEAVAALARVAFELGKCREAGLLQARAAEVARAHGLGSGDANPKELGAQLASFRERCPPGK